MVAFGAEGVDFASHLLGYEAEFFALSGSGGFHRFDKICKVFAEALLFLVDIEFFDVEYHFLFEAAFVVVGEVEFSEVFLDALPYLGYSLLLERLYLPEQLGEVVYARCEELFEFESFRAAMCPQGFNGICRCFFECGSLVVVGKLRCGCAYGVGETQQHGVPVGRLAYAERFGGFFDLLLVAFEGRHVQPC